MKVFGKCAEINPQNGELQQWWLEMLHWFHHFYQRCGEVDEDVAFLNRKTRLAEVFQVEFFQAAAQTDLNPISRNIDSLNASVWLFDLQQLMLTVCICVNIQLGL